MINLLPQNIIFNFQLLPNTSRIFKFLFTYTGKPKQFCRLSTAQRRLKLFNLIIFNTSEKSS